MVTFFMKIGLLLGRRRVDGCANNRLTQLEQLAKARAWELGKECRQRPESAPSPEDRKADLPGAGRPARSVRPYPPATCSSGSGK